MLSTLFLFTITLMGFAFLIIDPGKHVFEYLNKYKGMTEAQVEADIDKNLTPGLLWLAAMFVLLGFFWICQFIIAPCVAFVAILNGIGNVYVNFAFFIFILYSIGKSIYGLSQSVKKVIKKRDEPFTDIETFEPHDKNKVLLSESAELKRTWKSALKFNLQFATVSYYPLYLLICNLFFK